MSVATSSFFSTYAQLIQLETDAAPDSFYGTEDYHKIDSLGPTLPKLSWALPLPEAQDSATEDIVTVSVKSIKPQYKFSTLLGVPLNSTIYKVKTRLVEEIEVLKNGNVAPSDLKVMVKAKVVADSTVLSSLTSGDISFTVLVSAPKKEATPAPAATSDDPVSDLPLKTISEATWQKIHELLLVDLGSDAQAVLEKFKSVQ